MPFLLATAATAASLSPAATIPVLLAIIAALLGLALWFLQREIKNNDAAHRELKKEIADTRQELKADIKAVEGVVNGHTASLARIEGLLEGVFRSRLDRADPTPPTP